MINKNELTIGNTVLINGKKVVIDNIDQQGINQSGYADNPEYDYNFLYLNDQDVIEGIKITKETLLEKGIVLTENEYAYYFSIEEFNFEDMQKSGSFYLIDSSGNSMSAEIDYMHELENICLFLGKIKI
jgi:hypothetical protein